ncbi:DUF3987 domain-containing protein [Neosynechococcus sphagnicola]|uniref:DUF3987 domain-containing protein n=1 Tax=Neosynechococcus sphagnicola TaxID=1501145 RepID=UPI00068DD642|nr:DUF3987 domain-containing protein [Neosynechococcus sphagnicola]
MGNRELATVHLTELGYKPGETVFLRFFLDKSNPQKADDQGRKAEGVFPDLPWQLIETYQAQSYGVYFVVNAGGQTDQDVQCCRAIFYEHDNLDKALSASMHKELELPEPTIQVDTGGKSVHSYWLLKEPCPVQDWRALQTDLLEFADGDRQLKNPSRVMRLAGFIHPGTGQQATIINQSGQRYSIEQLRAIVPTTKQLVSVVAVPASTTDAEIQRALAAIPRRIANSGTYHLYRNSLWGLKAHYGAEQAIAMMEAHSPSKECGWNVAQVCRSGGDRITLGSLFYHAQQHGFKFTGKAEISPHQQGQGKPSPSKQSENELEMEDPVTAEDVQAILTETGSQPDLGFIHPHLLIPLLHRAKLLNVPVECFVGAILPVAASLLKVGTQLCLWQATDWYVPPILWTALVGESGTLKSPVWDTAMNPLYALQAFWDVLHQAAVEKFEAELEAWEKSKKEDRGKKPKAPAARELYFQDATLEAIAQSVSTYPENGTVCSVDELTQFSKGFDAYRNGRGGDRAKWLSAYDGKGLKVNRKGGTRISLQRSSISLSGGIQPAILRKEMGDLQVVDGFWQRIAYFPIPLTKAPVPRGGGTCNLSGLLEAAYRRLDEYSAQTFYLDSDARSLWNQWCEECEDLKVRELHPAIRALYPKAKERAARIALVIHCLNAAIAGTVPTEKISAQTLQGAIELTRWTLAQTRMLFADFGQGENPQAVKICRFVQRFKDLGWITARQVSRWHYPLISAKESREFMQRVVLLEYAVTNGEEPNSKQFKIKIVTDNTDKSPQPHTLQGIEVPDKPTDKSLTNADKSLTNPALLTHQRVSDGVVVDDSAHDLSGLSGNVSEGVRGFVSESEASNGKALGQFVSVVSDFGKKWNFKTGDRVRVIGGQFKENYRGLVLPIHRITSDGIACCTPEGRLTTWLNPQDLQLVVEAG